MRKGEHRELPAVVLPDTIEITQAEEHRAANGVPIYALDCSKQEVLRFSFVFPAGTSWQQHPFCAATTANLLSAGSPDHTAHEIAEALDFYGSWYDVSVDRDASVISFCSLLKFLPQTLALAEEILLRPTFPEEEVDIYRTKRQQRLAVERSKPDFCVRELFARRLFGSDHPYGRSYPAECYDTLTREQLIEFYNSHYTAAGSFVVASGNITDEALAALKRIAEGLPSAPITPTRQIPAPVSEGSVHQPFEGTVQTSIRIGRLLFPRHHDDFIGMQVVATLLGGYFGSRLIRNLREEHGYTYGAYCGVVNFDEAGYLAISTEVGSEVAEEAINEIMKEIERLRTEPVSEEELENVRKIIFGEVMRILDGPFGIADVTIENIQNGESNNYTSRMLQTIKAITPADVLALAQKYLSPTDLITVTLGG